MLIPQINIGIKMKYIAENVKFNASTEEISAIKIALALLVNVSLTKENADNYLNSLRYVNIPELSKLADEIEQLKQPS